MKEISHKRHKKHRKNYVLLRKENLKDSILRNVIATKGTKDSKDNKL